MKITNLLDVVVDELMCSSWFCERPSWCSGGDHGVESWQWLDLHQSTGCDLPRSCHLIAKSGNYSGGFCS